MMISSETLRKFGFANRAATTLSEPQAQAPTAAVSGAPRSQTAIDAMWSAIASELNAEKGVQGLTREAVAHV